MTKAEKMAFVQRCYDDVIDDIILCEEMYDEPVGYSSSQIIRDYKSEAAEYDYMTEEEFDELYAECDRLATLRAMAWC